MSERGFGRVIEAAKGVKALFDWVDRMPEPAPAEASPPELGEACARPQSDGWRCVRRGPHETCLLEEGTPHGPTAPR
jgi:hypothetical protein